MEFQVQKPREIDFFNLPQYQRVLEYLRRRNDPGLQRQQTEEAVPVDFSYAEPSTGFSYEDPSLGPVYNSTVDEDLRDEIALGSMLRKQVSSRRKESSKLMGLPSPPRRKRTKKDIEAADRADTARMKAENRAEIDSMLAVNDAALPSTSYLSPSQPNVAIGFPPGQEGMRPIVFDPRQAGESTINLSGQGTSESIRKAESEWSNFQAQRDRLRSRQLERDTRPQTKAEKQRENRRNSKLARQEVARDRRAGIDKPGLLGALQQQAMQTEIMRARQQAWQQAQQEAAQQAAMAQDAAAGPFPGQPQAAPQAGLQGGGPAQAGGIQQQPMGLPGGMQPYTQLAPGMEQSFNALPYLPDPTAPSMPAASSAILGTSLGVDPQVQVAAMQSQQNQSVMDQQRNSFGSQAGLVKELGGVAPATGYAPNQMSEVNAMSQMTPVELDKFTEKQYDKSKSDVIALMKTLTSNPNNVAARASMVRILRRMEAEDPGKIDRLVSDIGDPGAIGGMLYPSYAREQSSLLKSALDEARGMQPPPQPQQTQQQEPQQRAPLPQGPRF